MSDSVGHYASRVFMESSVNVVAAIVATASTPRRLFRVLVFTLFAVGFIYQVARFLSFVWQHPTVVTVDIRRPREYLTPAFTFCSNNLIKRSKFCAKYPDSCVIPNDEMCQSHSYYCGQYQTPVIKREVLKNISSYFRNEEDVLEFNPFTPESFTILRSRVEVDRPTKYFLRSKEEEEKLAFEDFNFVVCSQVNDRVNSHLDSHKTKTDYLKWNYPSHSFSFRLPRDDMADGMVTPHIFFAVHSPFDATNPAIGGSAMTPGHKYFVHVSMAVEILLPAPFKTDCINYTERWINNNISGYRSQEMCQEKCWSDVVEKIVDCRIANSLFSSKTRICSEADLNILREYSYDKVHFELEKCHLTCKNNCVKSIFKYSVTERDNTPLWTDEIRPEESNWIYIEVDVDDTKIYSLCYQPQFQEVEAFSYIGGFIGIWLGVSLVQVADFFEAIFRIARHVFRRSAAKCFSRNKEPDET